MGLGNLKDKKVLGWLRHDNIIRYWSHGMTQYSQNNEITHPEIKDFHPPLSREGKASQEDKSTHAREGNALQAVAFTLAEVLITLAIVGIVAAMTIPTLIQNYKEKQTVVKLKKVYSTLLNAYQLAQMEYGDVRDGLDWSNSDNYRRPFLERLMPYLEVSVDCKDNIHMCYRISSTKGSHYAMLDKNFPNFLWGNPAILLKDGTLIAIMTSMNLHTRYVYIMVDINGVKEPNRYGHDTFFFRIDDLSHSKGQILPMGSENTVNECRLNSGDKQAISCAWWVLTNENMDYLHCSDLDWKTQHKCSK